MSIRSSISCLYANTDFQLAFCIGILGNILEDNIRNRGQLVVLEGGVTTVDANLALILGVFTFFLEMEISCWRNGTTIVVFEDIVPIGFADVDTIFVHSPISFAHVTLCKTITAVYYISTKENIISY